MNSLVILSISHVAHAQDYFILERVSKPLALALRGDCPPKVTLHLIIPELDITNWLSYNHIKVQRH